MTSFGAVPESVRMLNICTKTVLASMRLSLADLAKLRGLDKSEKLVTRN